MGFQNTVVYDEAQIAQRYGLRPDQMIDFKALKGDTTDNIPGVPGVGEKTAAKLIAENGSIEGVYEDLTRFTPKLREGLAANKDQVFRSREMSRIITDLPVTLDVAATRFRDYDRAGVLELFRDLEFRSLIPRLPPADGNLAPVAAPAARPGQLSLGLDPAPAVAPRRSRRRSSVPKTRPESRAQLRAAASVAVHADVDVGRHPMLLGLGLAAGDDAWYVPTISGVPAPIAAVLADESHSRRSRMTRRPRAVRCGARAPSCVA